MGQITPRSLLEKTQITQRLSTLSAELKTIASNETKTDQSEWVVRDILPSTDLGFNTDRWVNQHVFIAPNTFEQDWTRQLPVDKYVSFYGVINHTVTPTIYGIKFRQGLQGSTTIDTIQFRKLLVEDNVIGYFDRIIYRAQSVINVMLEADAATAQYGEEFEILGMWCEKYGDVISGPKLIV